MIFKYFLIYFFTCYILMSIIIFLLLKHIFKTKGEEQAIKYKGFFTILLMFSPITIWVILAVTTWVLFETYILRYKK